MIQRQAAVGHRVGALHHRNLRHIATPQPSQLHVTPLRLVASCSASKNLVSHKRYTEIRGAGGDQGRDSGGERRGCVC